jgi:hypothetical protein
VSAKKVTQESSTAPEVELDVDRLRIDQDFGAHIQTRRKALVVPVGRPDKQSWIHLHPDPKEQWSVGMLDDTVNRRHYVVDPDILPEITADLVPKLLVPYATRQGSVGLWAIRLPDESGRIDTFNESALAIVREYPAQWIRVLTNQETRSYDVLECEVEVPTPKFPEGGIRYLLKIAFRNRVIQTLDHPVLKALRGGL